MACSGKQNRNYVFFSKNPSSSYTSGKRQNTPKGRRSETKHPDLGSQRLIIPYYLKDFKAPGKKKQIW